ncbi:hypothetical protein HQ535_12105 [bacterium]|nr:hypothetical protein [bacterium]
MKAIAVLFGFLSAIVVGAIVLFTIGEVAAILAFVALLSVALYAIAAPRSQAGVIAGLMIVTFLVGSGYVVIQAVAIVSALTTTEGPADPADEDALAAATDKIDAFDADGGFRLELLEDEIEAVIQDGLGSGDIPLKSIQIDIVDGEDDEPGILEFTGEFKSGTLDIEGAVTARLESGAVQIELVRADLGSLTLPGIAEGAIEDLVESVADLNQALADNQADVQSVVLADDRLLITGTQGGGATLTAGTLLTALTDQAANIGTAIEAPPEVLGPGVVDSLSADGPSYYVALGDSLASNDGVESPRDGYVSRFHRYLLDEDDVSYGLRNFGISGETTGTLIRGGQLGDALDFMLDHDTPYVTIDIGGNDLLGHLGSGDCTDDLDSALCQHRIASTFVSYEENLIFILDSIQAAAPEATVIFMNTYNPFSLGFGAAVGLETTSNQVLTDFNALAARIAEDRGILVADSFTPMQGTTAATTHMLDPVPDIHPLAIGFDILAQSLVEALTG